VRGSIRKTIPSFDQTPDEPEPFGYKVSWLAIKTPEPAAVVEALDLGEATPTNWASGLALAYSQDDDCWMFVSPSVDGWVFAVSPSLPYPTVETHHDIGSKFEALFSRLAARFDDVQFFGSSRVSGFCAWARALNGVPLRVFSYGQEVLRNLGDQTPEEVKLGFVDLSGLSPSDAEVKLADLAEKQVEEEERLIASGLSWKEAQAQLRPNGRDSFPDESDVVDLAALWSIDPTRLAEEDHPPGLGLAVRLPENMRQ